MRQQIDVGWLCQDAHQAWVEPLLAQLEPAFNRIKVHPLADLGGASPWGGACADTSVSTAALAYSSVGLRRYDAVVLTVTLDTLAWTRQCLAALPRRPGVQLMGVLDRLRSEAILDLLELGMHDFVRTPVCPQEFRARLIHVAANAPRPISLRENTTSYGLDDRDPRCPSKPRPSQAQPNQQYMFRLSELAWPDLGFQENKQRMIDLFERQYLCKALRQAQGNISEAARRSRKDRRAFWELMRRHGIEANAPLDQG